MKNLIYRFLKENHCPPEAERALLDTYEMLKEREDFHTLLSTFWEDEEECFGQEGGPIDLLCQKIGINFYTGKLLFFICLTEKLHEKYLLAGIPEHIYDTSMEELYTKTKECVEVYGIWGVFSPSWFDQLFHMKVFGMGRLCFNLGVHDGRDFYVGGRLLTQGDLYIAVHIPSSGKPFDRDTRLKSYDMAYHFFKSAFGDKEPVFRCGSWLLNPDNRWLLGEKSNIVSFMDDFKLYSTWENPANKSLWRVFGADYELPPEKLPRDTSLRRAYADYLASGHTFGGGCGFFVYDPVEKTTLK